MISAAQAFEIAHKAIAEKRYHEAPSDITVERTGRQYTVTFSDPKTPKVPDIGSIQVTVDAQSRAVQGVRETAAAKPGARLKGYISGKRAFEIGLAKARELEVEYDEQGTTTVVLTGERYEVIFPLPPPELPDLERSDYALKVSVNARSGEIVEVLGSA